MLSIQMFFQMMFELQVGKHSPSYYCKKFWWIVGLGIIIFPGIPFPPLKQWVDLYNHHCWTLRVLIIEIGSIIILMVVEAQGFVSCLLLTSSSPDMEVWKKENALNDWPFRAIPGEKSAYLRDPVQPPLGIGVFFSGSLLEWHDWLSCCLIHSLCLEGVFLMIAIRIEFWIHELFFCHVDFACLCDVHGFFRDLLSCNSGFPKTTAKWLALKWILQHIPCHKPI